MYHLIYGSPDGKVVGIKRFDGLCIPIDNENTDYQEFIKWNAEQLFPLDINIIDAETVAAWEADVARRDAKIQSLSDNLPSWDKVSTTVDNIANLADAKVFLKKLARVVYWLAHNKAK